jgi:hypothetical protein
VANTIAKLAVIITGDASPLQRSLDKAAMSANNFARSSIDGLEQKFKQFNQVLNALSGGNLMGAVVNLGKLAGPIGIAAAAAGALAFKLGAISDAQRVAAGANPADTWAGQFDRVETQVGRIAAILGRPIADVLAHETKQVADTLEMIVRNIMPEWVRQEEARIAAAKKAKDVAKQEAADKKKAAQEAEKAAQKARELAEYEKQKGMEQLGRARAIADSLRTPREELVATLGELSVLMNAGALSVEMYQRGIAKARDEYMEATKVKRDFERTSTQGVGAAERFTAAGFSAVQAGQRELKAIADHAKKQLEAQREQARLTKETNELIRTFEPVQFAEARL